MPLTIPNTPASPTAEQSSQSMPDQRDFDAIISSNVGTGVVAGCATTQTGGGAMNVTVAAGAVISSGVEAAVTGGTVTITAADPTNPRFDLIVASSTGTLSAVAGTPAPAASSSAPGPVFPAIPAGSVLIASVYVAASAASILTADIQDKRVDTYDSLMLTNPQPLNSFTVPAGYEAVSRGLPYVIPSTVTVTVPSTSVLTIEDGNGPPPWQNYDVYLTPGVMTGTGTQVTGGVIRQATSIQLKNTYTTTADPNDSAVGSPIYINMDWTGAYAGTASIGPLSASGYYGPRSLVQVEGRAQYSNSTGIFGQAPIAFSDQLLVKNTAGVAANYTPAFSYQATKIWVADNAVVTPQKMSWSPANYNTGAVAYEEAPVYCTANGGTLNMNTGGDYDVIGFESAPLMAGSVNLSVRVGFDVKDIGLTLTTAVLDPVFGSKVSGRFDTTTPVCTTQYGIRIPRMTFATNNWGVFCDSTVGLFNDTVTYTANPPSAQQNVIYSAGQITLTSGADLYGSYLNNDRTFVVDTTLNAFAISTVFNDSTNYKSGANTTNRDMKTLLSYVAQPSVTADQSDDTVATMTMYAADATLAVTGAGTPTLAVTTLSHFEASDPDVGASCTLATRNGLLVKNTAGAGVTTNNYAIDIQAQSGGGTKNRAIRIAASAGGSAIEMGLQTNNETSTTNLPASTGAIYFKGGNICFAYNDAGTIRYTWTLMTGTTTPSVWTHNTTGP